MTKLRTIILEDETIEIHHNEYLSNKPYLVRIFSYYDYYGPTELRMDESDLQNFLSNTVKRYES